MNMDDAKQEITKAITPVCLEFCEKLYATGLNLNDATDIFQREFIRQGLKANKGNRSKTAIRLGMHRNSLMRYLRGLNLTAYAPYQLPPIVKQRLAIMRNKERAS